MPGLWRGNEPAQANHHKQTESNKQMKRINTNHTLLAGAAIAGILSGVLGGAAQAATRTGSNQANLNAGTLADEPKKGETHDCAGKNGCKGKGGCKTGDNGCASKNSCKGKGGCAMKDGQPVGGKK